MRIHTRSQALLQLVLLAALAAIGLPAGAQSQGAEASGQTPSPNFWLRGKGYVGLDAARSDWRVVCGNATLGCDVKDQAAQVYAGTMIGNFWGAELGLIDMGRIARGSGLTRAQGLNLSLIGRAPLGRSFGVFGKLGTTYGHTETSSPAVGGLAAGSDSGFGLAFGAGVSYDFTPKLSATFGWDSHDFRFAGGGRDPVRATSLGLQYRY